MRLSEATLSTDLTTARDLSDNYNLSAKLGNLAYANSITTGQITDVSALDYSAGTGISVDNATRTISTTGEGSGALPTVLKEWI